MQKLHIKPELNTPEILFSPDENLFLIRGNSAPEDVRALYYPAAEWFAGFASELKDKPGLYSAENPLTLKIDLNYFNSSSAKFLYDIIMELRNIGKSGIPVKVKWYFEKDDYDMMEAGKDISNIVEMNFDYIEKE